MKTLSSLFALSLFACASSQAGSLLDLGIVDRDTGAVLSPIVHDGKMYVVGIPGHRYAVHLRNLGGERIMAVLSVDGVNAVSGESANPAQTGYVLMPYQSTEIDGWRKSMSEVAQFNFTALSNSYAARTGRAGNVGVIGVAVFREKQKPAWHEDKIAAAPPAADGGAGRPNAAAADANAPHRDSVEARRQTSQAAPANAANAAGQGDNANAATPAVSEPQFAQRAKKTDESLGTGHGAREASYVSYVDFERASSQPDEVDTLWYDSAHNLAERGILPLPRHIATEPQPFPRFVPDPAS